LIVSEALLSVAGLTLLGVAIGLARVMRGPSDAERLMALQLLGTGGIAALLLIAYATSVPGVDDVALGFALLAAFATVAFVNLIEADEGGTDA
jgi:multicomponent Na+:H+ antiporter subunit F